MLLVPAVSSCRWSLQLYQHVAGGYFCQQWCSSDHSQLLAAFGITAAHQALPLREHTCCSSDVHPRTACVMILAAQQGYGVCMQRTHVLAVTWLCPDPAATLPCCRERWLHGWLSPRSSWSTSWWVLLAEWTGRAITSAVLLHGQRSQGRDHDPTDITTVPAGSKDCPGGRVRLTAHRSRQWVCLWQAAALSDWQGQWDPLTCQHQHSFCCRCPTAPAATAVVQAGAAVSRAFSACE